LRKGYASNLQNKYLVEKKEGSAKMAEPSLYLSISFKGYALLTSIGNSQPLHGKTVLRELINAGSRPSSMPARLALCHFFF
jgi:hypothetical protein